MEAETRKKPDQEVIGWIEQEREGLVIQSKFDDDAKGMVFDNANDVTNEDAKSNNSAVFDPPDEEESKAAKEDPVAELPEPDREST